MTSNNPQIIGLKYSGEQVFSMAERGVRAGVKALAGEAKCADACAAAFLLVATLKKTLEMCDADSTKNVLQVLVGAVELSKNGELPAHVVTDLDNAVLKLVQASNRTRVAAPGGLILPGLPS